MIGILVRVRNAADQKITEERMEHLGEVLERIGKPIARIVAGMGFTLLLFLLLRVTL